jgi:NAD(P)-dependent dehydrogenase (short-subunit alcohol dehydrogenase family)
MLEGKTVLITGASSGIGRATAKIMAGYGANVVIAARREDESLAVVAEIEAAGGTASFIKTDVTVEADIQAAVSHAVATYGRLDCAANNSGGGFGSVEWSQATPEVFDKTFEVNVRGMWLCMKHEISQMLKQGGG